MSTMSCLRFLTVSKKRQLGGADHGHIKENGNAKALQWIALMLFVCFFICLGFVYASGAESAWTTTKVFFVAGFLLFMIGKMWQEETSTSKGGETIRCRTVKSLDRPLKSTHRVRLFSD